MKKLLYLLLFAGLAIACVAFVFGRVVPAGMMGVRQVTVSLPIGLEQGFSPKGLGPGYHWNIPFYTKIHLIPDNAQLLHLHRDIARYPSSMGPVEIQTSDGSSVIADISVISHFYEKPGKLAIGDQQITHGGPGDLIQKIGLDQSRWISRMREAVTDELKRALASLSTSEFYNPALREQRVIEAKDGANLYLAPLGISIDDVLVRRYTYGEERIDTAIFAKNLQDQEERLNKAASGFAQAQANLEEVAAELDAQIKTLRVEGENRVRVLHSQGDLYEAEQRAVGDLAVAKAKARVDELKAQVLAKTAGSDNFVAREMTQILGSLSGGVVEGVNPYDMEEWLDKLGVSKGN